MCESCNLFSKLCNVFCYKYTHLCVLEIDVTILTKIREHGKFALYHSYNPACIMGDRICWIQCRWHYSHSSCNCNYCSNF